MGIQGRAAALGRSARAGVRGAGRAVRGAGRLARRAAHAQGAGRSGLGALTEAAAVNAAGDAMVAVALAGTVFFGLDVHQARGQVALYLLVTMAPFALVAPLIGPALDRMRHARRYAVATTLAARGLLCWGMAGAVAHGDELTYLPAAFGVLVLSKAFGVLRSAATPLVLPERISLVTANARVSFAGLVAASAAAPIAAGLSMLVGSEWLLRITTVVFLLGAAVTVRLPRHVDAAPAEAAPPDLTEATDLKAATDRADAPEPPRRRGRWRTPPRLGPAVAEAVAANAALRAFSGFLILYLAFLLRQERFEPVSGTLALGLLAGCAGAGGLAGTALGAWAKARAPRLLVLSTLAFATAAAGLCAALFGLWAALAAAFAGALGQSLGKLSMDAVVQREVGEEVRSSTFAVTETLHQLVWVLGGLLGLGMSIVADGRAALAAVAAALAATLAALLLRRPDGRRTGPRRRARGARRVPDTHPETT